MATHQLDFHVTISSDSEEALLRLERILKVPAMGSLVLLCPLFGQVDDIARAGDMSEFEVQVSSVDINWDDTGEPVFMCLQCATNRGLTVDRGDYEAAYCSKCTWFTTVFRVVE